MKRGQRRERERGRGEGIHLCFATRNSKNKTMTPKGTVTGATTLYVMEIRKISKQFAY